MNPLLLMAHWGVGEVLLAIAILALLFGDRRTWEVLKRLADPTDTTAFASAENDTPPIGMIQLSLTDGSLQSYPPHDLLLHLPLLF